MESPKMYSSRRCKNLTYLCGTANDTVSCKLIQSRERKFTNTCIYVLPWYRVCTKAVFISKRSYRYGEFKNVFLSSVQKAHLPVRDCKRPCLKQSSIGPSTEICGNPGVSLAMVPSLHQSNVYIKRKLRVWRVQKCIPVVGAKTVLTCAGLQTTPSHLSQNRVENRN